MSVPGFEPQTSSTYEWTCAEAAIDKLTELARQTVQYEYLVRTHVTESEWTSFSEKKEESLELSAQNTLLIIIIIIIIIIVFKYFFWSFRGIKKSTV